MGEGSDSESDMEIDAKDNSKEEIIVVEDAESVSEVDRLSQYDEVRLEKVKKLLGKSWYLLDSFIQGINLLTIMYVFFFVNTLW